MHNIKDVTCDINNIEFCGAIKKVYFYVIEVKFFQFKIDCYKFNMFI